MWQYLRRCLEVSQIENTCSMSSGMPSSSLTLERICWAVVSRPDSNDSLLKQPSFSVKVQS